MKINYQSCYYSPKEGHEFCPHQHYCFFNKQTWDLMEQIRSLEIKLSDVVTCLTLINLGGHYCNRDYNSLELQKDAIIKDLSRLREFENKIKQGEVKGYGCE